MVLDDPAMMYDWLPRLVGASVMVLDDPPMMYDWLTSTYTRLSESRRLLPPPAAEMAGAEPEEADEAEPYGCDANAGAGAATIGAYSYEHEYSAVGSAP